MELDFPGIIATLSPEVLTLRSDKDLHVLASAVVGGGFMHARYIINRHVHKDYLDSDPGSDLRAFAAGHGIPVPFVGLMTAVHLDRARTATLRDNDLTIAAVVTAGLSNPTTPGLSPPASPLPGTINIILLVNAQLSPAAIVNAVITTTEVKTQLLLERGVRTPKGYAATGTSTDAVVVACTGRGVTLPYAGPATRVGWLMGRVVRQALGEALE